MNSLVIICTLVFAAGFVDAVAGGGGLISLPAYLIAGFPVHTAIGTNKLSSSMGTLLAAIRYAKDGFIDFKKAVPCTICAMLGSCSGSNIALMINEDKFNILMLFIIPLSALVILKTHALEDSKASYGFKKSVFLAMAIAFLIGIYDGFYGPGTGTFLILSLCGIARLKLNEANGLTKVINLTTNISALFVFLVHGKVKLFIGFIAGIFSILGNFLGVYMFERGGAKITKPLMIGVLCIFFLKEICEYI